MGRDSLHATMECLARRTEVADETFGKDTSEDVETADGPPQLDEIDFTRIPALPFIETFESQEMARFRARVCLDDWDGYLPEEAQRIIRELSTTEKFTMDAMHRELMALPPNERGDAIGLPAVNGENNESWWRNFLTAWEL